VVLHPAQGSTIERALGEIAGIRLDAPDRDGVVAALEGTPIMVTFPWRDEFLTPDLRWVQAVSAGVEHFPLDTLRDHGVILTSARGIHGPQAAEHAIGLLLAMTRGIAASTLGRAGRRWNWAPVTELGGMTLGILGMGVIGEAVAERARALGMRVIGTSRDPGSYDGVADEVIPAERMDEVFARSDAVVVALPGGEATRGVVGAAQLEALGEGWLVNVGRGSVVDEAALVEALTDGGLRGAGLDVFEQEPLPDSSPLWDLSNVVLTPHLAGASPHYGRRLADLFQRNLAAFAGEAEWINRVV
jgi:phosphoglycerate dehydrogenase-like enzyme